MFSRCSFVALLVCACLGELALSAPAFSLAASSVPQGAGIEDQNGLAFDFSGLERFSSGAFVAKPALAAFRHGALRLEGCRTKGSRATSCLH